MNIGQSLQRVKPALLVLRGWEPNGTQKRETVAPLAAGQVIMSGQVCSLKWNALTNREEYFLGWNPATDPRALPFFAKYDSTDSMITSSGLFSALSCADDYELQTGYVTNPLTDVNLINGAWLISDPAIPGNVVAVASPGGKAIIGRLSRGNGAIDLSALYDPLNNPNGALIPTTSNVIKDVNGQILVVQLQTMFQTNAAVAS